jgi:hypothetical protein
MPSVPCHPFHAKRQRFFVHPCPSKSVGLQYGGEMTKKPRLGSTWKIPRLRGDSTFATDDVAAGFEQSVQDTKSV